MGREGTAAGARSEKTGLSMFRLRFVEAKRFYQTVVVCHAAHQISRALVHPRRYQSLLHKGKKKIPPLPMKESGGSF